MPLIPHFKAPKKPLPFMRWHYYAFAFTALLTLATIASLAVQGLNLGVDFTGGAVVEATQDGQIIDVAAVRERLADAGMEEVAIQGFDAGRGVTIRLPAEDGMDTARVSAELTEALGPGFTLSRPDVLGPKVSGEYLQGSILAVAIAVIGIAVYVWFRFEFKFGVAALITTAHDVLTVFAFFSFTRLTFDMTVVAAVLTVAGYSINDTVVIYDRIRENLRRYKSASVREIIDRSITETLPRTMMTAGTVLITAIAMLVFAGPVLFGFAAAMVVGVLIGTYSSIFVAATLLIYLPGKLPGDTEERRAGGQEVAVTP